MWASFYINVLKMTMICWIKWVNLQIIKIIGRLSSLNYIYFRWILKVLKNLELFFCTEPYETSMKSIFFMDYFARGTGTLRLSTRFSLHPQPRARTWTTHTDRQQWTKRICETLSLTITRQWPVTWLRGNLAKIFNH